jgi:glutamine amidotransferase
LTAGLPTAGCAFYHVHSLAARPEDPADVIATTEYGERFATIVAHDNVFGVQFHPEKSSRDGLSLLGSFVALVSGNSGSLGRAAAEATTR